MPKSVMRWAAVCAALSLGAMSVTIATLTHASPPDAAADADAADSAATCDPARVYEVNIQYIHDHFLAEGQELFVAMDPARNTLDYREDAFDFFATTYGLTFDPTDPGPQPTPDGALLMQPSRLTVDYQVYSWDVQGEPRWRSRMPLTNASIRDDGYIIFFLEDTTVHGTYGGAAGRTIPAGSLVLYGEYRVFDHRDRLITTLQYQSGDPAVANAFGYVGITCDLFSDEWGPGVVYGLSNSGANPERHIITRNVMTFARTLADQDPTVPKKCDRLRP